MPNLIAAGLSSCGPASAPLTGSVCFNATAGQCCADSTKALIGEPVNGVGCYAAPYCAMTIQWGTAAGQSTQIMGELAAREHHMPGVLRKKQCGVLKRNSRAALMGMLPCALISCMRLHGRKALAPYLLTTLCFSLCVQANAAPPRPTSAQSVVRTLIALTSPPARSASTTRAPPADAH